MIPVDDGDEDMWIAFRAHRVSRDATTAHVIAVYDPESDRYMVEKFVKNMNHVATPVLWMAAIALRAGGDDVDPEWLADYTKRFFNPLQHLSLAQRAGPHRESGQPDAPPGFFHALDALELRLAERYPQAIWVVLYESGNIQHGVRYRNPWTISKHRLMEFLTVLFSLGTRDSPFITQDSVTDWYGNDIFEGPGFASINKDYILAQFATFFAVSPAAASDAMELEDAIAEGAK